MWVHAVLQRHTQQLRKNGRCADADVKSLRFAVGLNAGANFDQAGWAVEVVLGVLFAAPHEFDRFTWHGLGNRHRLSSEVLRAFATQAAAHLHGEDFDVFLRHFGGAGCCGQAGLWVLRRHPNLQLIVLQPSRADHGLEGSVG